MTKSTTRTTKTSAVFLAAVLVAGTFALMSPSFMGGAAAYPDYGMEKKYKSKYPSHDYENKYKSKDPDKKVIVKKVKCNNINVNINGLTVGDISRTTADTLAAQAAADEAEGTGLDAANFGGNNGPDFNIEDNFVFVCINNNNNAGQGGEDGEEVEACENCFVERDVIVDFGDEGIEIELQGNRVVTVFNFDELCALLEAANNFGQIENIVEQVVPEGTSTETIEDIAECLAILFDVNIPGGPPDSGVTGPTPVT